MPWVSVAASQPCRETSFTPQCLCSSFRSFVHFPCRFQLFTVSHFIPLPHLLWSVKQEGNFTTHVALEELEVLPKASVCVTPASLCCHCLSVPQIHGTQKMLPLTLRLFLTHIQRNKKMVSSSANKEKQKHEAYIHKMGGLQHRRCVSYADSLTVISYIFFHSRWKWSVTRTRDPRGPPSAFCDPESK